MTRKEEDIKDVQRSEMKRTRPSNKKPNLDHYDNRRDVSSNSEGRKPLYKGAYGKHNRAYDKENE